MFVLKNDTLDTFGALRAVGDGKIKTMEREANNSLERKSSLALPLSQVQKNYSTLL